MTPLEERIAGLERALTYIYNELGHVCAEFELCRHVACSDSCTAMMIASEALRGNYVLPGEETPEYMAAHPEFYPSYSMTR